MSTHTQIKGLRVALYGLITVLSVVTLGITAAMMNIYSGGGLPRFYSSDRLSLVTSEHAVLLCFVAAILTALNGVYRIIDACKVSSGSVTGHRISIGLSFLLFLVGASLVTSFRVSAAAVPVCRPLGGSARFGGADYDSCGSQWPRDDAGGNRLLKLLFGISWAATGLLLIAVGLSFSTGATKKVTNDSAEAIHEVVEKV